jgi:hypothetical protein
VRCGNAREFPPPSQELPNRAGVILSWGISVVYYNNIRQGKN